MKKSSNTKTTTKTEAPRQSSDRTRRINDAYFKSVENRPESLPKEFIHLYQESLLLALKEEGLLNDMEYDLCSERLEAQYYSAGF